MLPLRLSYVLVMVLVRVHRPIVSGTHWGVTAGPDVLLAQPGRQRPVYGSCMTHLRCCALPARHEAEECSLRRCGGLFVPTPALMQIGRSYGRSEDQAPPRRASIRSSTIGLRPLRRGPGHIQPSSPGSGYLVEYDQRLPIGGTGVAVRTLFRSSRCRQPSPPSLAPRPVTAISCVSGESSATRRSAE